MVGACWAMTWSVLDSHKHMGYNWVVVIVVARGQPFGQEGALLGGWGSANFVFCQHARVRACAVCVCVAGEGRR